jgi:hypothetical protein
MREGDIRIAYRDLVRNLEVMKPLERHRSMLEYNIKMGLREMGWGAMDWICLNQDRDQWTALMNRVMNLQVL